MHKVLSVCAHVQWNTCGILACAHGACMEHCMCVQGARVACVTIFARALKEMPLERVGSPAKKQKAKEPGAYANRTELETKKLAVQMNHRPMREEKKVPGKHGSVAPLLKQELRCNKDQQQEQ